MEVKAALQPPCIRLNASTRKYAIRILTLALKHPINQELSNLLIKLNLKLTHFKYPPWNKVTPYTVNICQLLKETTAQIYNSNLHTGADEFTIYTNASSMPGEDSTGYASKIAKPGQLYYIYSENQAGLYRLKALSDNPGQACQIRAIQAAELAKIYGNELADSLTKQATTLALNTNKTSFAVLGCKAKQVSTKKWESALN
ncbi:hypothetical protein DL98DRAFT_551596 [Cadophora sp. DSE1049]|nr:hypothetical protein DL98DRAFT_551596 [Cadophora sp. DSE1049]